MRISRGVGLRRVMLVMSLGVVGALAVAGATSAQVDSESSGSATVAHLAGKPEFVTFCHVAGRTDDPANMVALTLPYGAVFGEAGHFNEDGTPNAGHEQDYLGPCDKTPPPSAELTVAKTANGTSTIQHNYSVNKQVLISGTFDWFDGSLALNLPDGGSGTVTWKVTVTHSQVQTYAITGTITLSNGGGAALSGVNVTDSLPGAVIDCGGGESTNLTIPGNGSVQCSYTVTPGSHVTTNTATASWGNGQTASSTAAVEWAAPTEVGTTFLLQDSNGMSELLGLGDLPDDGNTSTNRKYEEMWTCAHGTAAPNSGRTNIATVTWEGGSDSDSASVQVGCGTTPPPPPDVCPNITGNQANVPAGTVTDGEGNCVTRPSPSVQIDEFMDVQVVKDATAQVQLVNGQADIAYTVRVRNNGPHQAHNVQLADSAPAGVTFLAVTTSPVDGTCTMTTALLSCSLGTLGPGVERTIGLSARVTQTGTYVNSATGIGDGKDTNGSNNTDDASTLVTAPVTPPTTAPRPTAKPKPSPEPEVCRILRVTPGMVKANGKQQLVLAKVTQSKNPIAGVAVRFAGKDFAKIVKTNAQGVARFSIKPSKAGIMLVKITSAKSCNSARIGVIGAFEPPVTG